MDPLSKSVSKGLNRVGEVYCPGFQALGCAQEAPRILAYLPASDRVGLEGLLRVLGWLPQGVTQWIVGWIEEPRWTDWEYELSFWEQWLAPGVRTLQLGLKGIAVSLYYADASVQARLGFSVIVDDSRRKPE